VTDDADYQRTLARLTSAIRSTMSVPPGIILSDRPISARFADALRRIGVGPVLEDGMRYERPEPRPGVADVSPRQVAELQLLIEQLRGAQTHIELLRGTIADRGEYRHYALRAAQLRIAADTERLFVDVDRAREYEQDVRAELAAAHTRAVEGARRRRQQDGAPLADPQTEARQEYHRARELAGAARLELERAYAAPGELQTLRRLAAYQGLAALAAIAVFAVVLGFAATTAVTVLVVAVMVVCGLLVGLDGYKIHDRGRALTLARAAIPAAQGRHDRALDRLVVAEAGMLALGLALVPELSGPSDPPDLSAR
jgi:hypothetical protein